MLPGSVVSRKYEEKPASPNRASKKLKVAFMTGIHDTVGYDLVSHCVSDIMVQGARPLYFLDYVACGRLEPGVVDRSRLIDGSRIRPGDTLLGLPSAGLHTNGYSLARRLFFDRLKLSPSDRVPELNATVGEVLLAPHRSYYSLLEPLLDSGVLRGMAHITGGGITDNLPRILPEGTGAVVRRGAWPVTPVFEYIRQHGAVDDAEMYRTFNMGIGVILVISPEDAGKIEAHLGARGEASHRIGEIVPGDGTVHYV